MSIHHMGATFTCEVGQTIGDGVLQSLRGLSLRILHLFRFPDHL